MRTAEGQPATVKLYSPRLLSLSAELANYPLIAGMPLFAEARSKTCGSTIAIGLETNQQNAITKVGLQVAACAVGQGSASILASGAVGHDAASIGAILAGIENWLSGDGAIPDWPDFDALSAVPAHPGRHGALLLPWKAAYTALSSGDAAG
ncbi:MAG: iron-sulfur cluster assembly scaffold protein [Pseudomonadota bacterium]